MFDFFIQQKAIVVIYFQYGAGIPQGISQVADKLYNLHQEFLQGKYDSVEELRKTRDWIAEEFMEKLRKAEEEKLTEARTFNARHGKISRRKRLKFRAYFL
ncbi:hypothetical protein MKX01_033201 [Papaver californicum]|nr:hypothetical protein MKX01_033201 [Papaver californicum]